MTTLKTQKDVIFVHCQEVPETICVETRLITQSGKQQIISDIGVFDLGKDDHSTSAQTVQTGPIPPSFSVTCMPKEVVPRPNSVTNPSIQQHQLLQLAQPANSFVPIVESLANLRNGNTSACAAQNNSNVVSCFGDQMQQTDISAFNTKSVAIQCMLDDELDDLNVEWPVQSTDFCQDYDDTESFLSFVNNNSTQHKKYKECLICGELCKSNKYFYSHMSVHRGPKALCSKCGIYLEHENLLQQHKCQKEKKLAKGFLKCPHYSCNVTAISLLELYDHINEHTYSKFYKCSACRKSFCTGQEFFRHIFIRAKCYKSAKKKRSRPYGLESQRDRQCRVRVFSLHTYKKRTTLVKSFLSQRAQKKGVCKICFKSLRNKFVYNHHRQICIAAFKKRLLKKDHK